MIIGACGDGVTVYPVVLREGKKVAMDAETFHALVETQDVLRVVEGGELVSLTRDRNLICKIGGRREWECSRSGMYGTAWKSEGYAMRRGKVSQWFYDLTATDLPEYVSWWQWCRLRLTQRERCTLPS